MSSVKPGDSVTLQFITEDENRSAAAPVATPTATLVQNGADDGAVTVTIASVTASAFTASFTVPATYSLGDQVQLKVLYAAGTRTAREIVWERTLTAIVVVSPATGTGADQVTLNIQDPCTLYPIADADVWVTSDAAGQNVVAGTQQTNSSGNVTFLLDAGTDYYLWMQKDGFQSIRGEQFTAVAD